MNIVSLGMQDYAGLSYHLCTAINELTPHYAASIVFKQPAWVQLPQMSHTPEEIRDLINNADVYHLNESLFPKVKFREDATFILHGHGTKFRSNPQGFESGFRKLHPEGRIIVSTPDLLENVKDARWFPSIVPIDKYRKSYPIKRNDPPVVYYTSTKPRIGMPTLMSVTEALRRNGYKFKVETPGKIPRDLNLRLKAQADICFDEIFIFYGVSSIEAGAFEKPVIYGLSPYTKRYLEENEINCPFIVVYDKQGCYNAMKQLIEDRLYRESNGKEGYEYVKRMHSPKVCVERFMELIE